MQITLPHIKIGVDEAGRGPWYGPVVACALAFDPLSPLPADFRESLDDSKKLTRKRRERIFTTLIEYAEA